MRYGRNVVGTTLIGFLGPCPVEGTPFGQNSAIELELHDRKGGSGSAQQAMLSAGPGPANPPIQAFGQNLHILKENEYSWI